MRERDVERELVKRVKAAGGEVRKLAWIGRRGAPDRLVMLPSKWMMVELKAPDGKLSKLQEIEHAKMKASGFSVLVVWKLEDIDEVFK
jgi:Holliday junction resolvase